MKYSIKGILSMALVILIPIFAIVAYFKNKKQIAPPAAAVVALAPETIEAIEQQPNDADQPEAPEIILNSQAIIPLNNA
jgi:hypothetical protein